MEKNNYIVAIDLGSGSVVAAAGSRDADGRLNVIDAVIKPVDGISAGEVTNIEQVLTAMRAAVTELETNLDIKVGEIYTGISGESIKCADSSYYVFVSGADGEIREEDVQRLHESMNSLQPPEGICILDRTPQKYIIDQREETMQPVGRFGQQLESTFNFIVGGKNSVDRMNKAFSRLGVDVRKLFTNAQADAAAVLTDDEKELGAAVVNIGAGVTDICIWQDNIMRYVAVLPIGSDAINHDIRSVAIPERYIEKLKVTHGYAVADRLPDDKKEQSIKIKGRTPRENKDISFYTLAQIIEARMMDIVENVLEEINESGYADKIGSGIVLTGGGSMLHDIDALFHERTKYEVRVGGADPARLNEDSQAIAEDLRTTTAIGLLMLGMQDSGLMASQMPIRRKEKTAADTSTNDKGHEEEDPDTQDNGGDTEDPLKTVKTKVAKVPKEPKAPKEPRKGGLFGGMIKSIKGIFDFEVIDDDEDVKF